MTVAVETARLRLRTWGDGDRADFLALCNSPRVMAHRGGPADAATVDAGIARIRACQAEHGHCFWAVERRDDGAFLGFCGLKRATDAGTPVEGEVEIGWRLREDAWGQGYAFEAASAALRWAWDNLPARRVIAITVAANRRSLALMERLGMVRRPDLDFDHPQFERGHPLCAHVTCVAERPARG